MLGRDAVMLLTAVIVREVPWRSLGKAMQCGVPRVKDTFIVVVERLGEVYVPPRPHRG